MDAAKHIIVTGAAGGIGASTVEWLVRRGVSVMAVDLDQSGLRVLKERIGDGAGEVVTRVADVTEEQHIVDTVDETVRRWGRLDGIFNNAGIEGPILPITRYPVEDFDRVMRVNTRSVFLGMKYAIPALLKAGGGVILNMASVAGLVGAAQLSGYISSKHSVVGLTKTVALEVGDKNIRVNAIAPGGVDTRMIWAIAKGYAPADEELQKSMWNSAVSVRRLGTPDEIANLATWLLLDAPGYINGDVFPIDGGQSAGATPEPLDLP